MNRTLFLLILIGNWCISCRRMRIAIYRAIESAQSFVFGFYPSSNSTDVQRESVPIHTTGAGDQDPLLRPTDFVCPAYEERYANINEELNKRLNDKYKEFVEFAKPILQIKGKGNIKMSKIAKLFNIKREMLHNFPQPPWVLQRWPLYENKTTIEVVQEIRRILRITKFSDQELARYRGGWILGDWIKKVQESNASQQHRMILYSAHDGTLLGLLNALRLSDGQLIPYTAALIMEVKIERETGKSFVEVF